MALEIAARACQAGSVCLLEVLNLKYTVVKLGMAHFAHKKSSPLKSFGICNFCGLGWNWMDLVFWYFYFLSFH